MSDTDTPAPAKKLRNQLTLATGARLQAWIHDNLQDVKDLTDKVLADRATDALGFTVTANNLSSHRRALGIEKTQPDRPLTDTQRIERMEKVLGTLLSALPPYLGSQSTDALLAQLAGKTPLPVSAAPVATADLARTGMKDPALPGLEQPPAAN